MNDLFWRTEKRKIKDLKLFENNPRKMSKQQAEQLLRSLKKFNLVEIPAIDQNNRVIAGNMRVEALRKLYGDDYEIEVRVPSRPLTEEEAREYLLRSNKNVGEWDFDLLANFDEDLLKEVGFESVELDEIFKPEIEIDDKPEIDDEFNINKEINKVLQQKETRCKEGDLWQLGEHRLYIGDCTKKESWEKVLGNEKFDFLFTDPPYKLSWLKLGVGFGAKKQRKYLGTIRIGRFPDYDEWLSIANEFQNPKGANVMVFENWRNIVELWQAIEKYWKIRNLVIWHKLNKHFSYPLPKSFFNEYEIIPLAGDGVKNEKYEEELENYLKKYGQKLLNTYEVILYGGKGNSYWNKRKSSKWIRVYDHISSIVDSKFTSPEEIAGTKPIQILVPYIKMLSPRNGIVVDCFGGSGSTLIACEIMKRKCRMIEIEPIYGDVIINRWEKFTGKKAVKL